MKTKTKTRRPLLNTPSDYTKSGNYLESLAMKEGMTLDQAIQLGQLLELKRMNDLFVENGNIFDEQMEKLQTQMDLIGYASNH